MGYFLVIKSHSIFDLSCGTALCKYNVCTGIYNALLIKFVLVHNPTLLKKKTQKNAYAS